MPARRVLIGDARRGGFRSPVTPPLVPCGLAVPSPRRTTPCCPDAAGLARVSREQLGTAAGVARRGGMEDQITVPPAEMEGGRGVSGGGVCSRCGDARFGLSSFLFFF